MKTLRTSTAWVLAVLLVAGLATFVLRPRRVPAVTPIREVPARELTLRDGRSYWKQEPFPFTGNIIEHYPDGCLKSRSSLFNGLLQGVSEGWYTNGTSQIREHFNAGVSQGRREKWYASGAKMSETAIEAGKLNGPFRRWHENGALAEEVSMIDDTPNGLARSYYPSGALKAQAKLEKGKVVEQQFWKEGEIPSPTVSAAPR